MLGKFRFEPLTKKSYKNRNSIATEDKSKILTQMANYMVT